jgi:hypothetical protein
VEARVVDGPLRQVALAILATILSVAASAQSPATPDDPWAPVRFMIGTWDGTSKGQPGEGTVVRRYAFVLRDRFIHETNTSTYPPQKDRKGEVHEHRSYISFDKGRKLLVLRQFHVEGFVNQFALNKELSSPARLVFDSENFENFSNRWRARETYEVLGPDEFIETFELAGPDKPFQAYSRNHFKRASR